MTSILLVCPPESLSRRVLLRIRAVPRCHDEKHEVLFSETVFHGIGHLFLMVGYLAKQNILLLHRVQFRVSPYCKQYIAPYALLRARVFLAQLRIGSSVNVSPKSRAIVICVPCCRRDVDENCWLHYQLSTLNVVKIGLTDQPVSVMVMSVNSQRSQDRILSQRNEFHRVTSKEKQRRHKLKGPRDRVATEHKKVIGKTGYETSRHKDSMVDGVH